MKSTNATLIVPAAGKSSRYPEMKPKWLLTHPNGNLMIHEVITSFIDSVGHNFNRTIITILREHCEKYDADIILRQIFEDSVEILILDSPTSSSAETVYQTLKRMSVNERIVIKDSDAVVRARLPVDRNHIVGLSITSESNVERVQQKSFIIKNDDDIIVDIIEKELVSNIICLGVYSVESSDFRNAYEKICNNDVYKKLNEMYVSHIVSYLIVCEGVIFEYIEADDFIDWGTKDDWYREIEKHSTYIFDIDGTLLKNCGRFGKKNWSNYFEPIQENIEAVRRLSDKGHEIIFMTARTDEFLEEFKLLMENAGIRYKQIVSGCNHSRRIIINDFATTNPHPSCKAISISRNGLLKEYIP